MGAPNLNTGYNTFQPLCMMPTTLRELIGVNGVERGFRWKGVTTSADLLGIDPPAAAPTVAMPVGGAATAGIYAVAYRFVEDRDGEFGTERFSNLSDDATSLSGLTYVTAVANDKFSWTALSARTQTRTNFVELWRSAVDDDAVLFLVKRLGAAGSITAVALGGGGYVVTSAAHGLAAGARVTISGLVASGGTMQADLNATLEIASVTTDTFTITDGTASGTYTSGGTWVLEGYTADTASDATLTDDTSLTYEFLPVTNDDGSLNAYRFVVPPMDRLFAVEFQDRTWYGGAVLYTGPTGATVSVSDGGTTITFGGSAAVTSEMAGRYITITGDTRAYLISSINEGAQTGVISELHSGALSGAAFTIYPDPNTWDELYYTEILEPESCSTTNAVRIQTNVRDHDRLIGAIPFGGALICIKERHLYELTYQVQPKIDANVRLFAHRGAFNHRCWDTFEGTAYLMDQMGAYAIDISGAWKPISESIQDLWRNGTIDFSKKKHFFVEVDYEERSVKFHVAYTGDTGTYPKRWLKYMIDQGTWTPGSGVHELGHSCKTEMSGRVRTLEGAVNDQVYLTGENWSDHLTDGVTATVVSGSGTTIVVAKAAISLNDWANAPIAITDGTGYRQIRRITTNTATSGGNVTITIDAALTTTLAAGDAALIGAIELSATTGSLNWVDGQRGEKPIERGIRFDFAPTTDAAELLARLFWDYDTTAHVFKMKQQYTSGWFAKEGESDLRIPLGVTYNDEGDSRGTVRIPNVGSLNDKGRGGRSVRLALRAYQAKDQVVIDGLTVDGIEE